MNLFPILLSSIYRKSHLQLNYNAAENFFINCNESDNNTINNVWVAEEQEIWYTGHPLSGFVIRVTEQR